MSSELDLLTAQQARVDRMIDEFRAARQRRLVKQGIALWDRTEQAYRNEAARGEPARESQLAMVKRPEGINKFEFAVVSSLRAAQLMRGCVPRVPTTQKMIMTAQLEVAAGKVVRLPTASDPVL